MSQPRESSAVVFPSVLVCLFFSGFAALLYETVWLRQFALVFGTAEQAVATVLAAYMGGLAVGAELAGRLLSRVRRPLIVYAAIELGIALSALALPLGLAIAKSGHAALFGGVDDLRAAGETAQTLFYAASAFLLILVPTGLMGATLPILILQAVRCPEEIGRRTAWLYAMNTAGAVMGAVAAPILLFLPRLGLRTTTLIGVLLNASVAAASVLVSRLESPPRRDPESSRPLEQPTRDREGATIVLPLMLVSGAVSFGYEVLWTRLLGHVIGTSLFAFATMLASFLAGIALGSALAGRFCRTRRGAALGFVASQFGIAASSMLVYRALELVPSFASALGSGEHAIKRSSILAFVILLPAALCIGATFPFAVRVLARDEHEAGPAAARIYAWNTVGAVGGALLAGFVFIPRLGFAGMVRLAVSTNVLLAATPCIFSRRSSFLARASVGTAALVVLLGYRPGLPEDLLRASPLPDLTGEGRLIYLGVGRSATVLVLERNGDVSLRINGLPEAGASLSGTPPSPWTQSQGLLASLPSLARPTASSMLVIGLGSGEMLMGAAPTIRSIDIVELEPRVVEANRAFASACRTDLLSDPRVRIVINDARSALTLTTRRYDVIVSQPSYPWSGGAAHLFTREFYRLVREHLQVNGVFLQWISNSFLDGRLLRTLGATLLETFGHVRLYRPAPGFLLFLGSDSPLEVERVLALTGEPLISAPEHYARLGLNELNDVAAMLALDRDGLARLCAGAPVSTDDQNLMAIRSSRMLSRCLSEEDVDGLILPFDPMIDPRSDLCTQLGLMLDRALVARRAAQLGLGGRAQAIADHTPGEVQRMLASGLVAGLREEHERAQEAFERCVELEPGCQPALYALIEPHLEALAEGTAAPEIASAARGLVDPAAAVAEGSALSLQGDWERLAGLEARLAAIRPRDLCYPAAARLRARWRSHLATDERSRMALGEEALDIIDRALTIRSEPRSLLDRLAAARAAGWEDAVVETADALLEHLLPAPRRPAIAAEESQRLREAVRDTLDELSSSGAAQYRNYRLEEVRERLRDLEGR